MIDFSSPVFYGLSESELAQMADKASARRCTFEKGSFIFHAGDQVQEMGIVQKGSVNIENIDPWGNKGILSNVAAGQVFAETYALCREPLMVNAVAAENCEIVFLNLHTLMSKCNMSSSWYMKIMQNMLRVSAQKNLILSHRIFCTTAKTVRGRLLTYLSAMAVKKDSSTFQVPFDRQQMADYLNLDRSALSKELGRMRDEGMIEFYKNTFKLKVKI